MIHLAGKICIKRPDAITIDSSRLLYKITCRTLAMEVREREERDFRVIATRMLQRHSLWTELFVYLHNLFWQRARHQLRCSFWFMALCHIFWTCFIMTFVMVIVIEKLINKIIYLNIFVFYFAFIATVRFEWTYIGLSRKFLSYYYIIFSNIVISSYDPFWFVAFSHIISRKFYNVIVPRFL